jgi:hypothetical protein
MKHLSLILLLAPFAHSQGFSVPAEWDITMTIDALSKQAARLNPILDQLTPAEWVERGASPTFVAQLQSTRQELANMAAAAKNLQKQPEKLSVALETYFRLQAMETQLKSLTDGVRTYQNPAVADLVLSVLGENSGNRDRLQAYISDLASEKEQEFSVVDREAQRCRATVNRTPAPAKKPAVKP